MSSPANLLAHPEVVELIARLLRRARVATQDLGDDEGACGGESRRDAQGARRSRKHPEAERLRWCDRSDAQRQRERCQDRSEPGGGDFLPRRRRPGRQAAGSFCSGWPGAARNAGAHGADGTRADRENGRAVVA
jgi:hypothetical protein